MILGSTWEFPLFHNRVSIDYFQFILVKVDQCRGWKVHIFSFAKRPTLMESVIQILSSCVIQFVTFLDLSCDILDKKCRNYLLGDFKNKMKIHLVFRDEVCIPKYFDALGLRMAQDIYNTSLVKEGWDLVRTIKLFGPKSFVISINVVQLIYPKFMWLSCDQIFGEGYVLIGNF